MERWFPSPDGERRSFRTAERRGCIGSQSPNPTSPRRHPVVPGSRGSTQDVATRGRLIYAGADAGLQNLRRTGEIRLAILPYGNARCVKFALGLATTLTVGGFVAFALLTLGFSNNYSGWTYDVRCAAW